jgi:hypothetical protein
MFAVLRAKIQVFMGHTRQWLGRWTYQHAFWKQPNHPSYTIAAELPAKFKAE